MAQSAYDSYPFISRPSPDRHPDRFATLGHLFGIKVKDPRQSKVLELGCGTGSNLIPMALAYKDAEFIGIDVTQIHIDQAKKYAEAVQAKNVRFLCMDVRSFDSKLGMFDYIICHGLYSWVPKEVQSAILNIFKTHLEKHGLAYLNFNSRPGWDTRGAIHTLLQNSLPSGALSDKIEASRKLLGAIELAQIDDQSPYGNQLRREVEQLKKQSDAFLASELLNPDSNALYFSEIIDHLGQHSLQYLCDVRSLRVQFCTPQELGLPKDIWSLVDSMSPIQKEQLFEVMYPRSLRSCLIGKKDIAFEPVIAPESLESLYVASPLLPPPDLFSLQTNDAVEFQNAHGPVIEVSNPLLKAALSLLGSMWPLPISFTDVCRLSRQRLDPNAAMEVTRQDDREALSSAFLSYFSVGLVELSFGAPDFLVTPVEKPLAHPFARYQAKSQSWLTNYRHEFVVLESVERQLLQLMDGNRTQAELVSELISLYHKGEIVGRSAIPSGPQELQQMLSQLVNEFLNKFQRLALISS